MKDIYLAGGCFWGTQKFFDQFDGIIETEETRRSGIFWGKADMIICLFDKKAE